MKPRIIGTGHAVPAKQMKNTELASFLDTNDAWIRERTGVTSRYVAVKETTSSLACEAAEKALADSGAPAEEIDLIIVSTLSPDVVIPSVACKVQAHLGASCATCFDLNAACSGFLYSWNVAQAFLEQGVYSTALLIGSECLSDTMDWTDRSSCILFGDGAGAVIVRGEEGKGFLPVTHADGAMGETLRLDSCFKGRDRDALDPELKRQEETAGEMTGREKGDPYVRMDGRAIFSFAVRNVPAVIREVLDANGLTMEEIDCFVLHQANRRIIEAVAKRLEVPAEKIPVNISSYGNTSSASIPILLDELRRSGKLKAGEKVVLAGFGGGLTWGASVVEL